MSFTLFESASWLCCPKPAKEITVEQLESLQIQNGLIPEEAFEGTPLLGSTPATGLVEYECRKHANGWWSIGTPEKSCFFNPTWFFLTSLSTATIAAICGAFGWTASSTCTRMCLETGHEANSNGACATFGSLTISAPGNSPTANITSISLCAFIGAILGSIPCYYGPNNNAAYEYEGDLSDCSCAGCIFFPLFLLCTMSGYSRPYEAFRDGTCECKTLDCGPSDLKGPGTSFTC